MVNLLNFYKNNLYGISKGSSYLVQAASIVTIAEGTIERDAYLTIGGVILYIGGEVLKNVSNQLKKPKQSTVHNELSDIIFG